jgi:hypothetical protein
MTKPRVVNDRARRTRTVSLEERYDEKHRARKSPVFDLSFREQQRKERRAAIADRLKIEEAREQRRPKTQQALRVIFDDLAALEAEARRTESYVDLLPMGCIRPAPTSHDWAIFNQLAYRLSRLHHDRPSKKTVQHLMGIARVEDSDKAREAAAKRAADAIFALNVQGDLGKPCFSKIADYLNDIDKPDDPPSALLIFQQRTAFLEALGDAAAEGLNRKRERDERRKNQQEARLGGTEASRVRSVEPDARARP